MHSKIHRLTPRDPSAFIRGEGMGGGVGGMVYSLKHEDGNVELIASHSNHRGDVIARSDSTGSLTSFALYEAYGTRPYEWGDDPDRQKANTKEEETDLGLLNEGMRYRDLETGTFLTRDPIGYMDGPNIYCYVHCNPITRFDAFGLYWDFQGSEEQQETMQNLYDEMYTAAPKELQGQLDEWAGSEDAITIDLVEGSTDVTCGSYNLGAIDLADIGMLPTEDDPLTQSSVIAHELTEQAVKQTEGLKNYDEADPTTFGDFKKAHRAGCDAEAMVNGGLQRDVEKDGKGYNWLDLRSERTFEHRGPITSEEGQKAQKIYKTEFQEKPDGTITKPVVTEETVHNFLVK